MGVLYVLDEPSIGLHQRDNARLIKTLEEMRDLGNTLLVVEHDDATIHAADWIIDLGPGAGEHGGEVVSAGTLDDIIACPESLTGAYISRRECIPVPEERRKGNGDERPEVVRGRRDELRLVDHPQHEQGIVPGTLPKPAIEPAEEFDGRVIPRPAKVVGQLAKAFQAIRQRR